MNTRAMLTMGLAAVLLVAGGAMAVNIVTVPVGNAGNTGELSGAGAGGYGPDRVSGAVGYDYRIAKHEVTAGQYTEFLNGVAGVDIHGLYNTEMWSSAYGCKIERYVGSGTSVDPYQYRVAADWANRPVNYVSWGDAARFANWLHNDQPIGDQDLSTTEDGAYFLNGAMTETALTAVTREADWEWSLPSEDEWYKAAYHKSDGATGNYFEFPTASDAEPSNALVEPVDPGNNATYLDSGLTIGAPYYRTEVGAHENSESAYGTFDQGGNVWEWNDGTPYGYYRGLRGGTFCCYDSGLAAADRDGYYATYENYGLGFRVVQVPEPAAMVLLVLGGVGLLVRRRRTSR